MAKTSGGNRGGSNSAKALAIFENKIRSQKFESAAVIDSRGRTLFSKGGGKNYVSFSRDEIRKMENNIITHNHPGGNTNRYRIGSSFSFEDLAMAASANASQIRAVAGKITFSMKRPKKGWGATPKTIQKVYNQANINMAKKLQRYIDNYRGNPDIAIQRANTLHYHLVSKEVAKVLRWNYSKTSK